MIGKEPLVSVIIPTYNRAVHLKKSIQSVLDQTYTNIEVIVVDGPSSDNTAEVVKGFVGKIKYIKENEAKGAGAARNRGLELAEGEYIAFQDSDNEWLPEKLEKQMQAFMSAERDIGMIYTGYTKITNNIKKYYPQTYIKKKSGEIFNELLSGNYIGCQTVVVRKECLIKVGAFDERLPTIEDWDLFLKIAKKYKILCINEPLVISYILPDSISVDLTKMIAASKVILQNHIDSYYTDRYLLSQYYFNNIGTILCENNQHQEGRAYIRKAIKTYPFVIKYYFTYFLSLLGNNAYRIVLFALRKKRLC